MTKDFLTFQSYDPRYGLGPFTLCLSLICGHSENEILLLKMQFCSYHCTAGAVNHNEHEINASDQIMVLHCFLPCLRQNQSWLKAPPLRDFACIHGSSRDILLQLSIKGPDQVGRLAHMPLSQPNQTRKCSLPRSLNEVSTEQPSVNLSNSCSVEVARNRLQVKRRRI